MVGNSIIEVWVQGAGFRVQGSGCRVQLDIGGNQVSGLLLCIGNGQVKG